MLAYIVPGEVVVGGFSILTLAIIYFVIQFSLMRERVSKLEEWVRQYERLNGRRN